MDILWGEIHRRNQIGTSSLHKDHLEPSILFSSYCMYTNTMCNDNMHVFVNFCKLVTKEESLSGLYQESCISCSRFGIDHRPSVAVGSLYSGMQAEGTAPRWGMPFCWQRGERNSRTMQWLSVLLLL